MVKERQDKTKQVKKKKIEKEEMKRKSKINHDALK